MQKRRWEGRRLSGLSLGYHSLSQALCLLTQIILGEENPFPLKYLVRRMNLYTREGYVVCKIYNQPERLLEITFKILYLLRCIFILCCICLVSSRKTNLLAMVKQADFPETPTDYYKQPTFMLEICCIAKVLIGKQK